MKKLEKLKSKKPEKINFTSLEELQKHKYLIFVFRDLATDERVWKFIKTSKVISIEKIDNMLVLESAVEGHIYHIDNTFFVTDEFTLAKIMCDKENIK